MRSITAIVVGSTTAVLVAGVVMADPVSERDLPVESTQPEDAAPLAEGIAGRVSRPGGLAVEGAVIVATSLDHPARPIPEIAILTDDDGRFEWPLRPGSYRLAALLGGQEIAAATATVHGRRVTSLDMVSGR